MISWTGARLGGAAAVMGMVVLVSCAGDGGDSAPPAPSGGANGFVDFESEVLPLFTIADVWAPGLPACDSEGCHTGVGGAHDLDMGSYEGIVVRGAEFDPAAGEGEPIVVPGRSEESELIKRLRNNRMPMGIGPAVPDNNRDGPFATFGATTVNDDLRLNEIVKFWIEAGAPDGTRTFEAIPSGVSPPTPVTLNFDDHVLPTFTIPGVYFPGSLSCNTNGCHTGPGGAHDLDMGSYEGIMAGAEGGKPIVRPGNPEDSILLQRLRNHRMPLGITNTTPRDGPGNEVLTVRTWIDQGAFKTPPPMTLTFSEDVLPLFTENSVWFPGSLGCNTVGCHTGPGGAHDLDMGSFRGIIRGAEEPIVAAGNPQTSELIERLRNNRMPMGVPPSVPRDGPRYDELPAAIQKTIDVNGDPLDVFPSDSPDGIGEFRVAQVVGAWIDAGTPETATFTLTLTEDSDPVSVTREFTFSDYVLPLFTTGEVWYPEQPACNASGCHTGVGGAHDLDMGSYEGIVVKGAEVDPVTGEGEPIIIKGNKEESELWNRLRNNRMPMGTPKTVPRDGPNGEVNVVRTWIEEGARDDDGRPGITLPGAPQLPSGDGGPPGSFAAVQAIFNTFCSCHLTTQAPQGEVLLNGLAFQSLVNVLSQEQPGILRVAPGDPDNSYLMIKIDDSSPNVGLRVGARMPLGLPPLSSEDIQTIREWIQQGAPNQ